jgi:hypothetical protein
MKLATTFTAIAAMLACTVSSMPLDSGPSSSTAVEEHTTASEAIPAHLFKRGEGFCGGSSFYGETSNGSPNIDDCKKIIPQLGYGVWYTFSARQELIRAGNCRFMVSSSPSGGEIGYMDITDLINDAIRKFGRNGKVGARGTMPCNGSPKVNWWIWKT